MTNDVKQKDLRYTLMPTWLSDFWNYQTSRTLQLMTKLLGQQSFPRFGILAGNPGSGKSAAAYAVGRWSSCKRMSRPSDGPCGQCEGCLAVCYGGDGWAVSSFREVAPAEFDNPSEALEEILHVFDHHRSYGDRPSWDGPRPRPLVLLINEAHRLAKSHKAALLTRLETTDKLYVLATTTDVRKMQIEPERPPREDPLIARGELFHFEFPTTAEAAAGLSRVAPAAGLTISESAALAVAHRNRTVADPARCIPRGCLADLGKLSAVSHAIELEHMSAIEDFEADSASSLPDATSGGDGALY